MRKTSGPRPPRNCSKSSGATANGMTTARASSSYSFSKRGAALTRRPSRDESDCRRSCSLEYKQQGKRPGQLMPINAEYRGPGELPEVIPVFPLPGALLLPRGQMPLNIFEPRYLAMVDDALRD